MVKIKVTGILPLNTYEVEVEGETVDLANKELLDALEAVLLTLKREG